MIVYTAGTFDLLHVGHLALLQHCKTMGDTLIVGVASDKVVNSYKPNVPIIPLNQRVEMLESLECVDTVHAYHELDYVPACKDFKIDVFVIGEDWGSKPHNLAVEDFLKLNDKKIVQIKYSPRNSSSKIKLEVVSQSDKDRDLIL